jgi:hypothetical protein
MTPCGLARTLAAVALGGVLAGFGPARAQPGPQLAPSAAVACLKVPDEPLTYPPLSFERKDGGTVRVELQFTGPDDPPRVKVFDEDAAFAELILATREHVSRFRMPCMAKGAPDLRLRQVYVFRPNDGRKVVSTTPRDPSDAGRMDLLSCMVHTARARAPDYPRSSLQADEQGNVFVELTFTGPADPPQLRVVATTRHRQLREAALDFAANLRLPCLTGERVSYRQLFQFRMDGGPRIALKDVTLRQFLGGARKVPSGVYFDLGTMACPFDLRVAYYQPHDENLISELEKQVPARQPLLDWLSRVELQLDPETNAMLLGSSFTVSVPCGTVDF